MPPFPFNRQLDTKLMTLVKSNPILYDPQESKYSDFDSREVVWQKIGDELARPAAMCKSRWVNMRDMYRRRIRMRQRQPEHKRRYNYKYEEEMSFMIPYFKDPINRHREEYSEFYDEDVAACDVELPAEVFVNAALQGLESAARDEKPRVPRLKNSRSKTSEDSQQDFNVSESVCQELNPADPIDVFLMTVGATLRKLNPYYLNQAKSKIFQVVQEYDLQQIMEREQSSNKSNTG